MATYRHLARIAAVQTIFSTLYNKNTDPAQYLDYLLDTFHQKAKVSHDFALQLVEGTLKHQADIEKIIATYAPEWPVEMIAPLDRSVLLMSIFEMVFSQEDVPDVVVINEAIEIGKEFSGKTCGKFINGVLSSVMEQHKPKNTKKSNKKDAKEEK